MSNARKIRCTDIKVNEVTKHIFKKYKKAKDYASAGPNVFESEIKPTGFYKNKAKLTSFNLALILHGSETCKAAKPLCPECILIKECEWPYKTSA